MQVHAENINHSYFSQRKKFKLEKQCTKKSLDHFAIISNSLISLKLTKLSRVNFKAIPFNYKAHLEILNHYNWSGEAGNRTPDSALAVQ